MSGPGDEAAATPVPNAPASPWTELGDAPLAAWLADVDAAVRGGGPAPSEIARWRREHPEDRVRRAIELARGRRSLEGRHPDASSLLADAAGAAMASDAAVAALKARRLADAGVREAWDLGCGIGGDAMAIAAVPTLERLVLVDRDPDRLAMARHNVERAARAAGTRPRVETRCADAVDACPEAAPGRAVHVDPARRDARGRRRRGLAGLSPDAEAIGRLVAWAGDVVVKLGPGTDPHDVPWPGATFEYVARGRTLVQALAWHGELAGAAAPRRATIVPAHATIVGAPDPGLDPEAAAPPPARPAAAWRRDPPAVLLVPHPAAERARLVSAVLRSRGAEGVGPRILAPGLGVLAADAAPSDRTWLEAFAVREVLPWRPGRVRRAVAALGGGPVVVRTRGGAVDPDAAARGLAGPGDRPLTVLVLRLGREVTAFVADALR